MYTRIYVSNKAYGQFHVTWLCSDTKQFATKNPRFFAFAPISKIRNSSKKHGIFSVFFCFVSFILHRRLAINLVDLDFDSIREGKTLEVK